MCVAGNGKDAKHTRHIASRMNFVSNGEKCNMHKIDWFDRGLNFSDIGTNNVSEPDITIEYHQVVVKRRSLIVSLVYVLVRAFLAVDVCLSSAMLSTRGTRHDVPTVSQGSTHPCILLQHCLIGNYSLSNVLERNYKIK